MTVQPLLQKLCTFTHHCHVKEHCVNGNLSSDQLSQGKWQFYFGVLPLLEFPSISTPSPTIHHLLKKQCNSPTPFVCSRIFDKTKFPAHFFMRNRLEKSAGEFNLSKNRADPSRSNISSLQNPDLMLVFTLINQFCLQTTTVATFRWKLFILSKRATHQKMLKKPSKMQRQTILRQKVRNRLARTGKGEKCSQKSCQKSSQKSFTKSQKEQVEKAEKTEKTDQKSQRDSRNFRNSRSANARNTRIYFVG